MISVIIPIYNGENYITCCIENLINQTYKDIEIIIIDDGSTDNTYSILTKYEMIDKRIKFFSFENHGVSWTRNFGMKQVNGDYFTFLDCDDYIEKDYLEILLSYFIKNSDIDAVFCDVEVVDAQLQIIKKQTLASKIYSNEEMLFHMLSFKNVNTGPCAKLFKKSVLRYNIEFPKLKIYEDLYFNIEILKNKLNIYYTDKMSYKYIHRDNQGAMATFKKCPSTDVIKAMDYAISRLNNDNNFDYLFYRIISQVMMYAVDCNYPRDKEFIISTEQFLRKNIKNLLINKSINKNEKKLYILYAINFKCFNMIRRFL